MPLLVILLALNQSPAACVVARGEVVYGAGGYDHYVTLENACDRAFTCSVSTDVNPMPIEVLVPELGTVSVLTFRGSPARVFTPYVTCVTTRP